MATSIKISQLPAKGSNLEATDLLEISEFNGTGYITKSITGAEIIDSIPVPSTGITIGTTAITSGTVGRVLFEGTGNVVQESANLFWDNTNGRLGVGGTPGAFTLDILGTGRIKNLTIGDGTYRATSITFSSLAGGTEKKGIFFDSGAKAYYQTTTNLLALESPYNGGVLALSFDGNNNNVNFYNQSGTILSKIFANTGNWGINTTTDAGFKLDVNGTARATSYTLGNYIINQASANLFSISNPSGASGSLFIYGGTTAQANIQINGSAGGNSNHIVFNLGTTARGIIFGSTGNWGINTTTDAGFKVDINGTARVVGLFTGTGGATISGSNTTISTSKTFINNISTTTSGFGDTGYGMAIDGGIRWGVNAGNSYKFGHWAGLNGAYNWNNASASVIEIGMGATTPNVDNITWASVNITPTFNANFSSRSGNIIRGIYYNPTITSLVNGVRNQLRAFESSFGGAYFNTTAVDGSAILQADSTTQGFLPPRMTTTQKNAIASPATGLMVYDTTLNVISYYNGTMWI